MWLFVLRKLSFGQVAYFFMQILPEIKNRGVVKMTRTVLVTGSSRGLGATIIRTLAQQGFQVIINYYKSKDNAEKIVSEIGREHSIAIQADVTKRKEVDKLVKQATEYFGQIDVVVKIGRASCRKKVEHAVLYVA